MCFSRALADFQSGNRHPATNGILRLPEKAAIALRCSASSIWIVIKLDLYTEGKLSFRFILGSLAWWVAEEALSAYWTTQLSVNWIMLITKTKRTYSPNWKTESMRTWGLWFYPSVLYERLSVLHCNLLEYWFQRDYRWEYWYIHIYINVWNLHISNFPWKRNHGS